jgi:hypothetical protein
LTHANTAFTNNGSLAFYVTTDTTTSIDAGTSPLAFNSVDLPTGLDGRLATRFLLGTGSCTEVADGFAASFRFVPTGAALAYLSTDIGSAGPIRLIIPPADALVAATFAGFANTEIQGPDLTIASRAGAVDPPARGLV